MKNHKGGGGDVDAGATRDQLFPGTHIKKLVAIIQRAAVSFSLLVGEYRGDWTWTQAQPGNGSGLIV